jgi:hypothetical protein
MGGVYRKTTVENAEARRNVGDRRSPLLIELSACQIPQYQQIRGQAGTPTGTVTEFSAIAANPTRGGIAVGPDGNLWFAEGGINRVGRITLTGTVTGFPVPTTASGPSDIAAGPDGNLWFTEDIWRRPHVKRPMSRQAASAGKGASCRASAPVPMLRSGRREPTAELRKTGRQRHAQRLVSPRPQPASGLRAASHYSAGPM